MSSTDTVGPSCLCDPRRNSIAVVDQLIIHTSGVTTLAKRCIAGATARAIASARRSASRFGTSSPMRSVKNDNSATNKVRAIERAAPAMPGGRIEPNQSARWLTSLSPP